MMKVTEVTNCENAADPIYSAVAGQRKSRTWEVRLKFS